MELYEYEKYKTTKEKLKETLDKYGVAIIPNVLSSKECDEMINNMWDLLEHYSKNWEIPIDRDDESTWKYIVKLYPEYSNLSMLISYWNIGHCKMSWSIRQNPKVLEIFSYFWNVKPEELLVSFDGVSIQMPPEVTKYGWFDEAKTWYHTDQSYTTPKFKYLQSWITGFDVNEGDSTLSFYESSNQYHSELRSCYNITDKRDWYMLNEDQERFYKNKNCIEKRIKCPRGSLVLWDGRTIHCGTQVDPTRTKPNFRCISYLCYAPRVLSDEYNLDLKRRALVELRTTSHNPCIIRCFPTNPYLDKNINNIINVIERPDLTEIGMKLSGF